MPLPDAELFLLLTLLITNRTLFRTEECSLHTRPILFIEDLDNRLHGIIFPTFFGKGWVWQWSLVRAPSNFNISLVSKHSDF